MTPTLAKIEAVTTSVEETASVLALLIDAVETDSLHAARKVELGYAFAARTVNQFVPILNHTLRQLQAQAEVLRELERMVLREGCANG